MKIHKTVELHNMIMKKLAIFDFDGTLFNSVDDVIICFNEALTINGFPTLTYEEYIVRLGGNIDEMVSLILKNHNTPENIELVKRTYESLYSDLEKVNSLPFPGMQELLKEMQDDGVKLAINSNRKNDSIGMFADKYFGDINFIAIEGHNPQYPSKPSPCGVERIMKKSNASNEETLYIGDSITDIKTAQNAQIDCVIVRWGYGNEKAYESDYILGTVGKPSEILNYF